ncbi:MAG: hypothetical protein NTY55_01065 [Flavobacteriia bacterium]|nr:hypothetical protein [Flavobacteriia bacterium]
MQSKLIFKLLESGNLKWLTTFLFLLFVCLPMFSQSIKGIVKDENNLRIKDFYINVYGENKELVAEYFFSKEAEYNIQLKKEYSEITIEISKNGYQTQSFQIDNIVKAKTYEHNALLKTQSVNELNEIIVTAKKRQIIVSGDTTKYVVSTFRDGSEKKLEDLLKKLPGIDVNEKTGKIRYKGVAIETLKLEGDDLFGKNYQIGTKNINIDIVEQIEAIENYNDNPLLKGIERDNKVAINLKLKKGKTNLSGSINSGVGINASSKLVPDFDVDILEVSKKYKSFAIVSFNNIGNNNSSFDYFGLGDVTDSYLSENFKQKKILNESVFSNNLSDKRTNINNTLFVSYNTTFKVNKKTIFKGNFYFLKDKIRAERFFKNTYIINDGIIQNSDNYFYEKKPTLFKANLSAKIKTNENSLLEWNLIFSNEDIKTPMENIFNDTVFYNSKLKSYDLFLKNRLLLTSKINSKIVIQNEFSHSFNFIPQRFTLEPGISILPDSDKSSQSTDISNNSFDYNIKLLGANKKIKYLISPGFTFLNNSVQSRLENTLGNSSMTVANFENNYKNSTRIYYMSAKGSYELKKLKFSGEILFQRFENYLSNRISDESSEIKQNIISPTLNVMYSFSSTSKLYLNGDYHYDPNSVNNLYSNEILTGYRTIQSYIPSLELQKNYSSSLTYNFNDFYNQLQITSSLSFVQNKFSLIPKFEIGSDFNQIIYVVKPIKNHNENFSFAIEKYVSEIKFTFKYSTGIYFSKYKNYINQSDLRDNSNTTLTNEFLIKSVFNYKVNFENTIRHIHNTADSDVSRKLTNKNLSNNFKLLVKPKNRLLIVLSSEYVLPNVAQKKESYNFIDSSIKYSSKNKLFDISLTAKNLLNNTKVIQVTNTDFSQTIIQSNLISRYFIVNVNFNF